MFHLASYLQLGIVFCKMETEEGEKWYIHASFQAYFNSETTLLGSVQFSRY